MTDTKMLKEMPKRIPVNGTFELTVRCNLHCKMCLFRHDDSENEEILQNELSASQWIDMARQKQERLPCSSQAENPCSDQIFARSGKASINRAF